MTKTINFRNKIISKDEIKNILNCEIYNVSLYQRAFCTKNYFEENKNIIFNKSNETLEFVGDSLINTIVVDYIEERFPDETEEFLSKLKMNITKTEGLSLIAKHLNFSKYILLSEETEKEKNYYQLNCEPIPARYNSNFLEDCFEAFIGAFFTDYKTQFNSGKAYEFCKNFVIELIEEIFDFSELILRNDNYKTLLQIYFYSKYWNCPEYKDIKMYTDKKTNQTIFVKGVYLSLNFLSNSQINLILEHHSKKGNLHNFQILDNEKILLSYSESYNKKISDQMCAKEILEILSPNLLDKIILIKK